MQGPVVSVGFALSQNLGGVPYNPQQELQPFGPDSLQVLQVLSQVSQTN